MITQRDEQRIDSKEEFAALSKRGLLGNFLRSWETPLDVEWSGYSGYLTIRARQKQSPWFVPVVFPGCLHSQLAEIAVQGGPGAEGFYFQEIPDPGLRRAANVEARILDTGLYLHIECNTFNPLRGIATSQPPRTIPFDGLSAVMKLKQSLRPESVEMLNDIWERYPSVTIEATEFGARCGVLNQHLVVWEARTF